MNTKIILIIIALIGFQTALYAENTATISVSCTIPEIPGVNAPAIETESVRKIEPQAIEKQTIEQTTSSNQILVKTIYTR